MSQAPSCGLDGLAVTIYRRPYVHRYCACAALRANVSARSGIDSVQLSQHFWYRLRLLSRSPHNAQHSTSYWGERERGPLLWTQRTRCHDRYRRPYVHRYCACAALRANVAGRIGNRFSPAESAFSACIGSGSSQSS